MRVADISIFALWRLASPLANFPGAAPAQSYDFKCYARTWARIYTGRLFRRFCAPSHIKFGLIVWMTGIACRADRYLLLFRARSPGLRRALLLALRFVFPIDKSGVRIGVFTYQASRRWETARRRMPLAPGNNLGGLRAIPPSLRGDWVARLRKITARSASRCAVSGRTAAEWQTVIPPLPPLTRSPSVTPSGSAPSGICIDRVGAPALKDYRGQVSKRNRVRRTAIYARNRDKRFASANAANKPTRQKIPKEATFAIGAKAQFGRYNATYLRYRCFYRRTSHSAGKSPRRHSAIQSISTMMTTLLHATTKLQIRHRASVVKPNFRAPRISSIASLLRS